MKRGKGFWGFERRLNFVNGAAVVSTVEGLIGWQIVEEPVRAIDPCSRSHLRRRCAWILSTPNPSLIRRVIEVLPRDIRIDTIIHSIER